MNKTGFVIVYNDAGQAGLQDENGQLVVPCQYDKILDYDDDGYIRVLKGDVYGTLNWNCQEVIPHSIGLTHLGVFYKGTARAVKNGLWGLVDEKGAEASDFCFQEIKAHRKWGYDAIRKDGVTGILAEDGTFTLGKIKTPKNKYQSVRVFHNDVAPAYTWQNKWIFVDRDLNRVNDYEYYGMDPVLRHGIYNIFWAPSSFGAAFYDGKPIIEEQYDYPLHFENGLTITQKKHWDKEGKEVLLANGQPQYDMGILKDTGEYLFKPVYYELHWNDYETKDCWYAEDRKLAYLLFPDGTRHVYDKRWVDRTKFRPSIPAKNRDKYMSERELEARYVPQEICSKAIYQFSLERVLYQLSCWTGSSYDPLHFYYRDTDAPIQVKKQYKTGTILRCGSTMAVTQSLLRPVHKYRFLIATRKAIETKRLSEIHRGKYQNPDADTYVLHKNSFFLVYDVYTYAGITQIVLLQLPCGFTKLAQTEGINLKKLKAYGPDLENLKQYARWDLQNKLSEEVHGYSLSEKWEKKMYQPIGLTDELKPVPLEKEAMADETCYGDPDYILDTYYDICMDDCENVWRRESFMKDTYKTIQVVLGDITRLYVDAIVNAANTSLLGGGGVDGAIHRAAGKQLLEACKKLNGCAVGESKMTDAYQLHCKKIIHTVGPVWKGGNQGEPELLARCYETALLLAEKHGISTLAFPCISTGVYRFPQKEAAQIALNTIRKTIKEGGYGGNVVLCCFQEEDAAIYKELLTYRTWNL